MRRASAIFLFLFILNIAIAHAQESDNNYCDTSSLEAKIDSLSSRTSELNSRVQSVESTVVQQENETRSNFVRAILSLPWLAVETIFARALVGVLNLDDSNQDIWSTYDALYRFNPDFAPLEKGVNNFVNVLIPLYLLVITAYSLYMLYVGVTSARAEIKTSLVRMFISIIALKQSYYLYTIFTGIFAALTEYFLQTIEFNVFRLSLTKIITNIDILLILQVSIIILGALLGTLVLIMKFVGLFLAPLIIFSLSLPWQTARSWGESLLNFQLGVYLAPIVSLVCLSVVPLVLESTSGLSSILINRLVLLCSLLLAIILPTALLLVMTLRPVVKVVMVTKILQLKGASK